MSREQRTTTKSNPIAGRPSPCSSPRTVATTARADICLPQGQKTKFESCVTDLVKITETGLGRQHHSFDGLPRRAPHIAPQDRSASTASLYSAGRKSAHRASRRVDWRHFEKGESRAAPSADRT